MDVDFPNFPDNSPQHRDSPTPEDKPFDPSLTTDKQYIANANNRLVENLNIWGTAPAIEIMHLMQNDHTDLGVTESVTIGTALGNGIALFLILPLMKFVGKFFYRTGNYKVFIADRRCTEEEILALQKNEIVIWNNKDGKLCYLVKGTWKKSYVLGEIAEQRKDTLEQNYFNELMQKSRQSLPHVLTEISGECKAAFLRCTEEQGRTYTGKFSRNPLFRVFRTLSKIFAATGVILSAFISGDNPAKQRLNSFLLGGLFSIIGGLFALPYYALAKPISKLISKKFPNFEKYHLTATEGWSKYVRTFQALFTAIGQAIGGVIVEIRKSTGAAATSFGISFYGSVAALVGTLMGFTIVPIINYISAWRHEKENREKGIDLLVCQSIPKLDVANADKSAFVLVQPTPGVAPTALYFVDKIRSEISLISFPKGQSPATFTNALYGSVANHAYSSIENLSKDQLKNAISISGHELGKGILTTSDKDIFRNNYARLGMMLFGGIGAFIGLPIGYYFGLNSPVIATIFSAAFSVVGGVVLSVRGKKKHEELHPPVASLLSLPVLKLLEEPERVREINEFLNKAKEKAKKNGIPIFIKRGEQISIYGYKNGSWAETPLDNIPEDELDNLKKQFTEHGFIRRVTEHGIRRVFKVFKKEDIDANKLLHKTIEGYHEKKGKIDIENSWDYAGRSSGAVFGFVGSAIACMVNPAGALVWAPVGWAIASSLGCILGIGAMRWARNLRGNRIEKKAESLPWSQRITMGSNEGSALGSVLGLAIGVAMAAGPAGIIYWISVMGAIGALGGGVRGVLSDSRARRLIWRAIKEDIFRIKPPEPIRIKSKPKCGTSAATLSALKKVQSDPNLSEKDRSPLPSPPTPLSSGSTQGAQSVPLRQSNREQMLELNQIGIKQNSGQVLSVENLTPSSADSRRSSPPLPEDALNITPAPSSRPHSDDSDQPEVQPKQALNSNVIRPNVILMQQSGDVPSLSSQRTSISDQYVRIIPSPITAFRSVSGGQVVPQPSELTGSNSLGSPHYQSSELINSLSQRGP